ncbi:MAG: MBL fold metallo-hydrolase [Ferrovum sp. 37-45-19]|uniref:MBL fold metallo-hydrolase n=1 Tax=Ferrovum sp. JA12 TaxID=1356299 RepID=UPI000703608E|nr:MBL fold metallo-hydrolase [Ferrovum sp. JA12]OYV80737.1 MAG: MBL fold metallo-hydrolase [Ferrovum sp. 21-44-67]OYV95289.1 MAG: MBL fold metallo-hydrolase [Ferrovum sp. 37-45-19]OZB33692.1 MAG: MBL fold metallo-hydrolase [Ferrovum sp. 34-44-207]HQT80797.1 MBL fold metallo-hydrolase [Ferrovaceae bacterium]KRH79893.1 putative metallo-hydrolase [Ferrovum sp. JA12]
MDNHVVKSFFDPGTWTYSYVVYSSRDLHCVIIDPVLNFQQESGHITYESADELLNFIRSERLVVDYILETHAHADHLSAGHYIQEETTAPIAIGEKITEVQKVFKSIFNFSHDFPTDGSDFNYLLKDKDVLNFGELSLEVLSVPGHTPACMAYKIGDTIFVGDTLFMPDVGTARCDFPGGDAKQLYHSVQKILSYPDDTLLYLCHDYPPPNRQTLQHKSTVKEQKEKNIHLHSGVSETEFVTIRNNRDKTLTLPKLIFPAIQLNIRAGKIPTPESNGVSYLKIPLMNSRC